MPDQDPDDLRYSVVRELRAEVAMLRSLAAVAVAREQEAVDLRAECDRLRREFETHQRMWVESLAAEKAECERLRAELDAWEAKPDRDRQWRKEALATIAEWRQRAEDAERELAEARKDTERLDWLESDLDNLEVLRDRTRGITVNLDYCARQSGCPVDESGGSIREVVDAARAAQVTGPQASRP